jgi:hypothetical protein
MLLRPHYRLCCNGGLTFGGDALDYLVEHLHASLPRRLWGIPVDADAQSRSVPFQWIETGVKDLTRAEGRGAH